jgi:hypothetical protein
MDRSTAILLVLAFPVLFLAIWLAVTTLLALLSGWFSLMRIYPDRDEQPVLHMPSQSGSMGLGVNLRGVLTLDVCPSGLRVVMMRAFGPFSRPFLVSWSDISVVRKTMFFTPVARLSLGNAGSLTITTTVADRLASAAGKNWPEAAGR